MKKSLKKGFSFGLTSAVIAALGLMVGLNSGTESRIAIITGMLIISITDSSSDAFGVHISEKSHKKKHFKICLGGNYSNFFN
jgi:vacuolar iron transporter family protein